MNPGKPPAAGAPPGAEAAPRHGPRWLGAIVPRVARPAFRRGNPAAAGLMADWPAVIGPALAAVTRPVRLARAAKNADGTPAPATLTIRCAGPVALELQHMAPQVMARINQSVGFPLVGALRFERGSIAPPRPPVRPAAAAPASEAGLEAIADPELRAALAVLRAHLPAKEP